MRVERIELIGFKSFSEKTVFNLHPGVTAIVGPNGCGKSNVVDAFRWVLGEQSARSLRGDSMEDVIFSGSATRKTRGMAEVTLVISGINEQPQKSAERDGISVTRRLYRSGESEYLMNKVPCRLKDIKNVFLDTGLELKAYSILEQGRVNDILNSKPQDRRFLIEEVAGVMKYKVRKAEALQKLESSKSNLQRLQDIINEVKRQINSIDRHAKRAEKYKKLFEEIKSIDVKAAKRDVKKLQNELATLMSSENTIKTKEAELSASVHSSDALIEEKKRACVDSEKSLGELRTRLHSLEKEAAEDEGKAALLKRDCENLSGKLESLSTQHDELVTEKERATASLKEIEAKASEIEAEILNLEGVLDEKNESFSNLEEKIAGLEEKLEDGRKELFSKAADISNTKNESNQLSLVIENIDRKKAKDSEDIDSVKKSLASLSEALTETKNEYNKSALDITGKKSSKEELADKLSGKKEELAIKEEALYKDREDLAAMSSKLDSLKEMDESRKSAVSEGIKTLGFIADIFETRLEYETAIEAALGDKLNAAVVDNNNEVTKAFQLIKQESGKRSGFISLKHAEMVFPAHSVPAQNFESQSNGVIGRAVDFITVKKGFENVAAALLNDVVLVNDLKTAFSMLESTAAAEDSKPIYFATLDGEVLEPSGMVFGGLEKGVLKVKRMLKALDRDIALKKEQILKGETIITAMKDDITLIEDRINSINEDIFNGEKLSHELKVKIESMNEENKRQQKKLEYFSMEMDENQREEENLKKELSEKELTLRRLENERQYTDEKINSIQNTITDKKTTLESLRSELTEVRLNLTAIGEKKLSFVTEKERLDSTVVDMEKKKENILNERLKIEEDITHKEGEIKEKEKALKSKIISIDGLQTEVLKIEETLEARSAEVAIIEKQQKSFASELDLIRQELSQVEMKNMELSMKLNYLKEDIRKTYSIEIETADVTDTVTQEEEERLPELKERLEAIGPVSLGTLEEFEELKTRYEFLTKQQNDLLQSIAALEDTIIKINRSTQKRLSDAFEALNEKFKEVFTTLFGKGRAELILTEGNILESGIDIVAQPPGKRLKNLMLLSGGEQALTAISLLFAGFMVKPAPLCILDEVDAPLDESNTGRFIKLLLGLSKNIQFITITHNRLTMESADYLYGITMEEPGVSKVVSMHMAEAV